MLIIQIHAKDGLNFTSYLENIFKGYVKGIGESYTAARGIAPDEKTLRGWELICSKGISSLNEISKLKNTLFSERVERYNNITKEKNIKIKIINQYNQKEKFLKRVSISLQIIGLIVVLIKDDFIG